MSVDETDFEGYQDGTDTVECYHNGKTMECECGQGFGLKHEQRAIKCPSCGDVVIDKDFKEREAPDRDKGQSSLAQW